MFNAYETSPIFYTENELSATALNIIRGNVMILQGISKRAQPTFSIGQEIIGFKSGDRLRKLGFMYRTGMTTATLIYVAANTQANGSTFTIYFDGVVVHTRSASVNETATIDIDITSMGYTDKQIISVDCKFIGGNDNAMKHATYYIKQAYVHPLHTILSDTFPTINTFGAISETNLNLLGQASDWLADRLNLVPYIPLMGDMWWEGTHKTQDLPLWYGTVTPLNGNNSFKAHVNLVSRNATSYIRVACNSTNVDFGPYSLNQSAMLDIDVDITALPINASVGTSYLISIDEYVTSGHNATGMNSRMIIDQAIIEADNYTYTNPPTEFVMEGSMEFDDLQAALNTLRQILIDCNTAIETYPEIFDRQIMFSDRFAKKLAHIPRFENKLIPIFGKRVGNVLWVKGTGLSIEYGPMKTIIDDPDKDNKDWTYEFLYKRGLTDGDDVQEKFFYLDQFEGLYPGVRYHITGKDFVYAAEFLKTV